MDKQEIEHKLEQARKDERGINDNIIKLLEQLAEAEKPKLGHGDFGINKEGDLRLIVRNNDKLTVSGCICVGKCIETLKEIQEKGVIFGNIFDLMKDWGEPLGENVCIHGLRIEKSNVTRADIFIGGDEHLNLAEAYEFWCKLGHKIMTLKRKQS